MAATPPEPEWNVFSELLAPDNFPAKILIRDLTSLIFEAPDIAPLLNSNLLAKYGVRYVEDLKCLPLTVVREACTKSGLDASFTKSIARLIFPKPMTFPLNASFGEGKEEAQKVEAAATTKGWLKLRTTGEDICQKSATDQVGGIDAMLNHFDFCSATRNILKQALLSENALKETTVAHTIFMFWSLVFKTAYIDSVAKQRVATLLYRISRSRSPQSWDTFLKDAFANRRQSRFTG
eukprot:6193479-Pleurochrysis_carterae.AAC.2